MPRGAAFVGRSVLFILVSVPVFITGIPMDRYGTVAIDRDVHPGFYRIPLRDSNSDWLAWKA